MTTPSHRSRLPRLAGEFMAIVLGVLVALGVDEWRENQADDRQEIAYYRSLIEDLDRDTAEYRSTQRFLGVSIRAAEQVFGAITGTPSSDPFPTLAQAVQFASWVNLPAWSSGTMDELVNSGSIRLIGDPEIKRALLDYHAQLAEWKPRIRGAEFSAFIDYRTATASWFSQAATEWVVDRSGPPSDGDRALESQLARRLSGNEEILGLTQQMIWQWRGTIEFMNEFEAEALALRALIEEHLEGA